MSAVFLNELGLVCALGNGVAEVAARLFASEAAHGVVGDDTLIPGRTLALGKVQSALPTLQHLATPWQGRNNAVLGLAMQELHPALEAARARYGSNRIGVVLGTSTSGVGEAERAHRWRREHGAWPPDYHYAQQEMGTTSAFVAREFGLHGPSYTISTACSSSAKALAAGARLLRAGMADAVIAGGADSLCRFTVEGFAALGAVSARRCNPFSAHRDGINIGEGAALFLLTREPGPVRLAGWGESSDAHHMSAPDPSGAGPARAIQEALGRAGLRPDQIDYLNLHGTATVQNDAMESDVVHRLLPGIPCSSTKPLTGHALGAAGAIEAAICWITLTRNPGRRLPPHWWDGVPDPQLPELHLVAPGQTLARGPSYLLSQSFAFGGSNAALILGAG